MKINRRSFLGGSAAAASVAAFSPLLPAWARSGSRGVGPTVPTEWGPDIALTIENSPFTVGGRTGKAITINGTLPAPLLRMREGDRVHLAVTNRLEEDTSIHWHGFLIPFDMDGVPGVSFPGIRPGQTFHYEFTLRQSGTYWYHSHSGLQEQAGHYGPVIIDPAAQDPVQYDREHVMVLSDWAFMSPERIFTQLKQEGGHFNRNNLTLFGLFNQRHNPAQDMSLEERVMWKRMTMDPTDISDVTGAIYTYLINGHGPQENWTGLFVPGERVRLRFINASAMTVFNVRIPGLPMTVVNADGENVRPVTVGEFQVSVAETYDVIVQPTRANAYTVVAEAVDRSGMGRATLAPRMGMAAAVPPLRPRPLLTMADMGMGGMGSMGGMDHGSMGGMNHGSSSGMDSMGRMNRRKMRNPENAPPDVKVGVGVDMIAPMPKDRTGEPGLGLKDVGHRVLTYRDLVALKPNKDQRRPSRYMEIHLTGNMERFMWSFDGKKFSSGVEPFRFALDERVRVTLVNDTMMQHPIHLHGHFMELVNGHPGHHPLKHTLNVLPGSKLSFDLTADNPGDWAFHCHLLYHMHAGMFNVVTVRPLTRRRRG
ncbi:copper resistance system multicopper oxidase [Methyloceanibacter sp.]|uniref:copper resistance system multicopper oxidase n=1 Tax=Methyloceanibacter sp. TaxID=1965321 RepID=UPI002BA756D9|nr:copper resistance system multicopper oxidase [Methyloceanibacter sp.]HML93304.1 copper resistance system multicopper oxidase [Methyloceanibacter sp.]